MLGQIHASGPMGRADVARAAGLTTQAVSNIIADLEADGMLHAVDAVQGRRGLPVTRYALNADGGYALGIELRPGAVLAALLDLRGETVWHDRRAVTHADPAATAAMLPALRDAARDAVPGARDRLLGAGIAMPGPFGPTVLSGEATDLPGWAGVDAATHLSDALGMAVVIANDANAAAMAERIALAAEGIRSFACLYFGTGLGLGIVQDGRLVTGAYGNAGEVGRLPVATAAGPVPLEAVLSRAALIEHGGDIGSIDAAHREGRLDGWIGRAGDALSQALAVIENLLDPGTTVLCGAMPASLLHDLVAATPPPRTVARRDGAGPPLRVGTCARHAAARGGAALVLARVFTPII